MKIKGFEFDTTPTLRPDASTGDSCLHCRVEPSGNVWFGETSEASEYYLIAEKGEVEAVFRFLAEHLGYEVEG